MKFTIYPDLPASDVRRAAAWFREKMDLRPTRIGNETATPDAPIEPDTELLYETGTATFGVYQSPHAGSNQATAARLVVADFDAAFAQLVVRGVTFEDYDMGDDLRTEEGVLVSPDGEKTAWFKDSEGNILALGSS